MKDKMKTKKRKHSGQQRTKVSEKEMADMNVDDMFSMIQDDNMDVSDDEPSHNHKQKKKAGRKKTPSASKNTNDLGDEDIEFEDDENLTEVGKLSRKEYLEQLKKSDPQFYRTILQSSDVMALRSSDEDDDDDEEEEEEEEDPERGGAIFVPPAKLEVDSDESDADEEEGQWKRGHNVITSTMVNQWEEQLEDPQPLSAFLDLTQALLAAIESLGTKENDETAVSSKYKVEGPQIFNSIIRLCLRKVPSVLATILSLKTLTDDISKTKKWSKYRNFIKSYLRHIIMLTECMAEASVAETVLSRGVMPLLPYYTAHPQTCKLLFKRLITMWATSEKRVRVLAFICIFRLARAHHGEFLEWMLKRLYLTYVQNCRFTSPSTWGLIDFMRISLVELYALNPGVAYKQAFIYIRQLAFHLRNAITIKKQDRLQLVYNWQYIHSLHLWADLLAKTHPNPALQPMIYPLTQIAVGTMKLQPTPSFYPLVFHVCGILTEVSRQTGTFIPILPFLLEILNKAPLEKKHKKASIKPFDWMCMLRLSRIEMTQSAFKDGVVDQFCNGVINYLSVEAASIGYPELVVPATIQMKDYMKKCKVPNYSRKIKLLLDKIKENKDFIESKRREVTFGIADTRAVQDWEISVKQSGPPFIKYYESWKKAWEKDQLIRITNRVTIDDYNLPTVKRREIMEKQKAKDKDEFKDLFASDDDDDDSLDDETRFLSKNERSKLKKKAKKVQTHGDTDSVEDNDGDEEDNDGDDEDNQEENDDDYERIEPPSKKRKDTVTEKLDINDPIPDNGVEDFVREFEFSDIE